MEQENKQITEQNPEIIKSLVLNGDLSKMNETQKVCYYKMFCDSLGLNPYTKPFAIIKFQGKEMLYATKDATEQLRKIHGVSVTNLQKEFHKELNLYVVTCQVQDKYGRTDAATGAVNIKGLMGDALCNAILKAETKSKRRATLSICGLGALDESETDSLGKIETKQINITTTEIKDEKKESYLNKILECGNIDDLVNTCKKAKEEYINDLEFHAILKKAYVERKDQLEFIQDYDGDQRGNIDISSYDEKHG